MRSCRCLVLIFFWVLSLSVVSLPGRAQEYHLHPPSEPIPLTLFGLHIHRAFSTTPWPTVPFGTLRLWDANVTWRNLEPRKKGELEFVNLDKTVSLAADHQVEILMNLGMSPPWASARPNEGRKGYEGATAEPKNMQDWRDFVHAVATRYKGRIHYWEIWNEPNDKGFYTGTTDKLLELAQIAYETLKQVDPSNTVVSPSATYGMQGTGWLDSYLRAGGGPYADVIGYHLYVTPQGPEAMVPLIQKIRSIMAHGVGNKPIWNTETGWFIQNSAGNIKGSGSFTPLPALEGAGYVARSYILAWAAGVPRFYWYDWDSETMGLAEDGGKTRKPAAYAYEVTEKWLLGARMTACNSDSSATWVCELTRDGGYTGYLVWNPRGSREFRILPGWKVQSERELDDHKHELKGIGTVQIGIRPILLENKAP